MLHHRDTAFLSEKGELEKEEVMKGEGWRVADLKRF